MRPRRRPRRRRLILALIVLAGMAWTAAGAYQLVAARDHAQTGLDELEAAQKDLGPAELIRGKGLPAMRAARGEFDQAADAADSTFLVPFKVLPFVGRQVRSVDALTSGASTVVHVGVEAMERSTKELDTTSAAGPERVALLERLGAIGRQASAALADVGLGPKDALVGALADARSKFARQLRKAQRAMLDVDLASTGIAEMAKGPSKYLVLAANNAEMRAGSGMLLSAGVLTVNNGQFSLGQMISVTELELDPGVVPLDGDFGDRWGWVGPTEEWRYLAMSPQFDVTGRLAAQMWKAKTGEEVDGVLALDAIALRALIKVSGPVEVEGKRIDEGNVVSEILLQQYLDDASLFGGEFSPPLNDQRRERNGVIAQAIVDQLDRVGWDIANMVDDLRSAARGRHLLFWSSKPAQQRAWRAAGVSGVLPADALLIAINNRGGNKLDQFLPVVATIEHEPVRAGSEVTVTITVANLTPATGLPRYVEGPYESSEFVAGEYAGILAVNIPGAARDIHLVGVGQQVVAGPDGRTRVVGAEIQVRRGETKTYTLRFTVPKGFEHLDVIPSARYPAIKYTEGDEEWDDDGPHEVRW